MFQITHLTKKYGQATVLEDLNLEIYPGEIVGIVGENGAGKSTLFNVVSGFLNHDEGEILLENKPIHHLEPYTRAEMGLARTFEWDGLFPDLTVEQNLELVFRLPADTSTMIKFWHFLRMGNQIDKTETIESALDKVGMTAFKDYKVKDLSSGQQKLIELARVSLQDWKILILDEPLAGISNTHKIDLVEKIKNLKQVDKAIVLIEHDIEFISQVADRILTLNCGRLMQA